MQRPRIIVDLQLSGPNHSTGLHVGEKVHPPLSPLEFIFTYIIILAISLWCRWMSLADSGWRCLFLFVGIVNYSH